VIDFRKLFVWSEIVTRESELELKEFLLQVSESIGRKLASIFPTTAVEKVCIGFWHESFGNVLDGIDVAWAALGPRARMEDRYEDVTTILLVQMIGPLNRLSLPENVERGRLFHCYLSIMNKLLQHVTVRTRFAGLLEQSLKAA